ncbi:MAG: metalloregulator ArsR/SmtB family transcription factor [Granulosicoccus sp.]|nr:metalloregulator ArsR/SmtB family transcription factor [Granulosicoccus sp.]
MSQQIQKTFRALADPTRREILHQLSTRNMTIGELTNEFPITRAAVKKHLTMLEEGNLISVHVHGRERINQLEPNGLKSINEWMSYFDRFWDQRLSALQDAISNQ